MSFPLSKKHKSLIMLEWTKTASGGYYSRGYNRRKNVHYRFLISKTPDGYELLYSLTPRFPFTTWSKFGGFRTIKYAKEAAEKIFG